MIAVRLQVNNIVKLCLDLKNLSIDADSLCASDNFKKVLDRELTGFDLDPIASTKALSGGNETFKAKKFDLSIDRVTQFLNEYKVQLTKTYSQDSHVKSLDDTFNRMAYAILDGSFNKDSQAIKNTCKTLKIKYTYKAINHFLKGEV